MSSTTNRSANLKLFSNVNNEVNHTGTAANYTKTRIKTRMSIKVNSRYQTRKPYEIDRIDD